MKLRNLNKAAHLECYLVPILDEGAAEVHRSKKLSLYEMHFSMEPQMIPHPVWYLILSM